MLRVRTVVLGVDDRVEEAIKWKSLTFVFEGNIASIDPRTKTQVNLMFPQGEASGGSTRSWRAARAPCVKALETAIPPAWIELKSG